MAVSALDRQRVRQRAGFRCEYCHCDERWQFVKFTIDHVVPRSQGGGDEAANLALACRNCNERRGNRCVASDPDTGKAVPVFNPRCDRWPEHFAWNNDRVRLMGMTSTGRATVAMLDMNDDRHGGAIIRIRRRDLIDGYHPPPEDPVLPE
jgi:hypothetical protein